jgi:beta-aspartyl-peptidase (threonine type)
MKLFSLFILQLVLVSLLFSCTSNSTKNDEQKITNSQDSSTTSSANSQDEKIADNFGIVIHGGAGTILRENMTPEKEAEYKAKLEEAIKTGHKILAEGGSSLDAVEATIRIMEDSPLFNAAKGAVFTADEKNELDASIMNGADKAAGAIAGVTTVKNPISLARQVMENSPHVMMAGKGAEIFAKERGLELVSPDYFYTQSRFDALQRVKAKDENAVELDHDEDSTKKDKANFYDPTIKDSKFGTVGCAALDKNGNLAAGTSTGGMTNKKYGRVGDAPIIGAGTYANNATCAVSSTGWGEYFIRNIVAYDISAMMEYKNSSLQEAAKEVIQNKLSALGGDGGIIAIDKNGNVVMEFNTSGMYRASMNKNGELYIGIYEK